MNKTRARNAWVAAAAVTVGLCGAALYVAVEAQGQAAPRYNYDPGWPKTLPTSGNSAA